MTHDAITARNRANAQRSTGPKTSRGKATSTKNALSHGATARPDPKCVLGWLAVILDQPGIGPTDLIPTDERGRRALALAEAEARKCAAEGALLDFEGGRAKPAEAITDLRDIAEEISEELAAFGGTKREVQSGISLIRRIRRTTAQETLPGGKRHRLLKRYLREARAQQRRAFAAWVESRASAQEKSFQSE